MTEDNPDRAPKVIRCEHWSEELGRFGGWHHHEGSHACDWGATMASVRTGFAWPISGTRHRIGANPPRRGMLRPVPRRLTPIPPPNLLRCDPGRQRPIGADGPSPTPRHSTKSRGQRADPPRSDASGRPIQPTCLHVSECGGVPVQHVRVFCGLGGLALLNHRYVTSAVTNDVVLGL